MNAYEARQEVRRQRAAVLAKSRKERRQAVRRRQDILDSMDDRERFDPKPERVNPQTGYVED